MVSLEIRTFSILRGGISYSFLFINICVHFVTVFLNTKLQIGKNIFGSSYLPKWQIFEDFEHHQNVSTSNKLEFRQ